MPRSNGLQLLASPSGLSLVPALRTACFLGSLRLDWENVTTNVTICRNHFASGRRRQPALLWRYSLKGRNPHSLGHRACDPSSLQLQSGQKPSLRGLALLNPEVPRPSSSPPGSEMTGPRPLCSSPSLHREGTVRITHLRHSPTPQ